MANSFAINDVVLFSVQGTALGQSIVNTYALMCDAHPSDVDYPNDGVVLTAILDQIELSWGISVLPLISNEYDCGRILIGKVLVPGVGPIKGWQYTIQSVRIFSGTGGAVGDCEPTFAAATAQKRGAYPGRNGRGGNRYGPLVISQVINNRLTPAAFDLADDANIGMCGAFHADLLTASGLDFAWAISSFTKYLAAAVPASRGIATGVNPYIGSQVSRKTRGYGA